LSCSSSGDDVNVSDQPTFAMTATINGTAFLANNPFGTNLFSSTNIWSYYPLSDYVMLQGGTLGTPEINIWLKRTQIAIGTYNLGLETFATPSSHYIDLTDLNSTEFEYNKNGTITITSVYPTTKL
jgi:hypothetical protein